MELIGTRKIIREVLELVLEHQPSYGDSKHFSRSSRIG